LPRGPDILKVPFVDLSAATEEIREDLNIRWNNILDNSSFIGGAAVQAFEQGFSKYCGSKFAVATGSGTDALRLAMQALGIGPGDSIISVPNTFVATITPAVTLGATPLFVDIDPETNNMDVDALSEFLTEQCDVIQNGNLTHIATKTRVAAIVPVHLYGRTAQIDKIQQLATRFNLPVIEDACQAHGATLPSSNSRAGTSGVIGCFSFYPGKNLGAFGDAGALVTDDQELAEKIKMMRDHYSSERYVHQGAQSWNSRLDVLQAEVLSLKLPLLDRWNQRRIEIANRYWQGLQNLPIKLPIPAKDMEHVYHLFVVEVDNRDQLKKRLTTAGIDTGLHYPIPIHLQPGFAHLGHNAGSFPNSEASSARLLSLPIWPHMTDEQVDYVIQQLNLAISTSK
jgi:dTDP-4-amino-4,6-dideoxygalactose transaminase